MDILFTNGIIRTMERDRPASQALLVRDGRIAAVGDRAAAEDRAGAEVRRIDLAGRTLLPAFLDAHSHFTAVANQFLQVPLEGCTSWADLQARVRDYIRRERIPAGQWVTAQGYDHNQLAERRHPDRTCLDAAAPENPVVICHQSGHMGVFNTAALERLGVTEQTPAPAGGVIGHQLDHAHGGRALEAADPDGELFRLAGGGLLRRRRGLIAGAGGHRQGEDRGQGKCQESFHVIDSPFLNCDRLVRKQNGGPPPGPASPAGGTGPAG